MIPHNTFQNIFYNICFVLYKKEKHRLEIKRLLLYPMIKEVVIYLFFGCFIAITNLEGEWVSLYPRGKVICLGAIVSVNCFV